MGKVYTRFQTKTLPDGAADTYVAYIREYPPGPEVSPGGTKINLGSWMCCKCSPC